MKTYHEKNSFLTAIVYAVAMVIALTATISADAADRTFHINPDRNIVKGQTALAEGRYETALSYFENAARKNLAPDHQVAVQNSICASLYMLERYDEAKAACSAAIEQDRGYWKAYVNRGNSQLALGDPRSAVADFCMAKRLSPNSVSGNFEPHCDG